MKNTNNPCYIEEKYKNFSEFKKKYIDYIPEINELTTTTKNNYFGIMFYELTYANKMMKLNYEIDNQEMKKASLITEMLRNDNFENIHKYDENLDSLYKQREYIDQSRKGYSEYDSQNKKLSNRTLDNLFNVNQYFETTLQKINPNVTNSVISNNYLEKSPTENVIEIMGLIPFKDYNCFLTEIDVIMQINLSQEL